MYKFEYLHHYASYLLEQHLDDYTREQIRLSFEIDLPLLTHFKHFSEEEMFLFAKKGATEFLTNLSNNNAQGHIENSLHRWVTNQIPMIDKLVVEAKDITLINHVRGKALKNWLYVYTSDVGLLLKINGEIDDLLLNYNTALTDAYFGVLKESIEEESHFSTNIINATPGITFIYDLIEQKEIYINGKVEEVMGLKAEEVLAMPNLIAQLTYSEDLPVVADFLKRVINDNDGKTQQAEYRFRNKQGKYNWLRCYASVYKRDAAGKPLQIIGVAFEISNEKEIASALLKREKQLLEAQAIGQIGSYEWDIVNDKSESTPELRRIFESDKRKTLEELLANVHPDDKDKLKKSLEEAFNTGIYKCEYRYRANKGEKVIDSRGVVTFDEQRKPLILSGTIQDITERKRTEQQLISKTLELERSNVQLQEFAYIASHDLKEPLRKISIFSNFIMASELDVLSEKGKMHFQKITEAIKRMQQLIEGILSYSSLSGQTDKEHYNLQEALGEALNNLELKIKESGAVIKSGSLPVIKGIPFQLQQLFQNLISNALKFSKRDVQPQINILCKVLPGNSSFHPDVRLSKEYLELTFADNGIGFDKAGSEKIFGLFQRLHGRGEYEGSGLGLAICKKITENHGGVITATSQPGHGATFTIILPVE